MDIEGSETAATNRAENPIKNLKAAWAGFYETVMWAFTEKNPNDYSV